MNFSNPRLFASFDNWPSGGQQVHCKFWVEWKKGLFRVGRATTKNGVWCKPKYHTYGSKAAIVDGDDGKTYILQLSQYGNDHITISRHDFMSASPSSCFKSSDEVRFQELMGLILKAQTSESLTLAPVGTSDPAMVGA